MKFNRSFLSVLTIAIFAFAKIGALKADDVRVGLLGGVSGPIAAMAPPMINAAQLAFDQVNAAGGLFDDGSQIETIVGDSGCSPQNAADSATKLVNISNVSAIVGPHCSGAATAAAESVTIPAGVAIISPSATAPTISALDDSDLVFRTVPSDAYQGQALARTLIAKGINNIAITYLNNDYGSGLASSFRDEFEKNGGNVTAFSAHEGEKVSYRSELANLASGGADTLAIFDYGDGSGLTILRQALENRFFDRFIGGDGMKSGALVSGIGASNLVNFYASSPVGVEGRSLNTFNSAYENSGGKRDDIFVTTSYDAAFILALAIEQAGSGDKQAIADAIRSVSTAPGVNIYAGEWQKAKDAIANGQEVNYIGASGDHEFDSNGDVPGVFSLFRVGSNDFEVDVEVME